MLSVPSRSCPNAHVPRHHADLYSFVSSSVGGAASPLSGWCFLIRASILGGAALTNSSAAVELPSLKTWNVGMALTLCSAASSGRSSTSILTKRMLGYSLDHLHQS